MNGFETFPSVPQEQDQTGDLQNIVMIGGGSGTSALAPGYIDAFPDSDFTIVTGIADSGSKTGRLRELYGGGAVGDLSKVIGAVSANPAGGLMEERLDSTSTPDQVRDKLYDAVSVMAVDDSRRAYRIMGEAVGIAQQLYEHEPEGLKGHRIGNLILTSLRLDHGDDIALATKEASEWMETRATVLPSTNTPHDLVMSHQGRIIRGEGEIDDLHVTDPYNAKIWLEAIGSGEVSIYEPTREKIIAADQLLFAPGSYWTSIGSQLAINGFARAVQMQKEQGMMVAIANLTVDRDTPGFQGVDSIRGLGKMAGRNPDAVVYNTAPMPERTADGRPVVPLQFDRQKLLDLRIRPIAAALVGLATEAEASDPIARLRSAFKTSPQAVVDAMINSRLIHDPAMAS